MRHLIVALILAAGPALAEAPETSLRPKARPGTETAVAVTPPEMSAEAGAGTAAEAAETAAEEAAGTVLPLVLPEGPAEAESPENSVLMLLLYPDGPPDAPRVSPKIAGGEAAAAPAPAEEVTVSSSATQPWYELEAAPAEEISPYAPATSLRPPGPRPQSIIHKARVVQEQREAELAIRRRGAVCGDIAIQGEEIGNHPGPGACGVENAVRVRSVGGISLSTPAIIDCRTAAALRDWVERGLKPAVGAEGGGPVSLHIMASYSCRNRVGSSSSRISEHAFGHAVDIGGVKLADGSSISVLHDWGSAGDGAQLRQMHQAACGIFGTVLGPEANAAHRNHFHFDTARYRSGSYCR